MSSTKVMSTKVMSLFIPHVFPNFTQEYVSDAFSVVGFVERVDFVAKQDKSGKNYNAAYIHFKYWYDNKNNRDLKRKIIDNGSSKFYHDDSEYYWIVLENTAKKYVPGERKQRINVNELNTPEKQEPNTVHPNTPVKSSYAQIVADKSVSANLDEAFEYCLDLLKETEEELEMAELEAEMQKDDEHLISIDSRYVAALEQENAWVHQEIAQLRQALINLDHMYQAEAAKVRAFSSVDL
jgi:hypothetical protein